MNKSDDVPLDAPFTTTPGAEMTTHPMLFSSPMVRALLDGTKTQTRRAITPRNTLLNGYGWHKGEWERFNFPGARIDPGPSPAGNIGPYLKVPHPDDDTIHRVYPAIQPRDMIWVREGWQALCSYDDLRPGLVPQSSDIQYPASYSGWVSKRRNALIMPRWASRITLRVTDVRVQRLQDISEEDALAEGVPHVMEDAPGDEIYCSKCHGAGVHGGLGQNYGVIEVLCTECETAIQRYHNLWNTINGPGSWGENPWVIATSFTVEKRNVDHG